MAVVLNVTFRDGMVFFENTFYRARQKVWQYHSFEELVT